MPGQRTQSDRGPHGSSVMGVVCCHSFQAERDASADGLSVCLRHPCKRAAAPVLPPMHAYVYKSLRKDGAYVFLATRDDFERVPEAVRVALEPVAFVLTVELDGTHQLARGNADEVRNDLAGRGFHVQMPPPVSLDPLTEDWGTDA